MSCPNCGMPESEPNLNLFECGSFEKMNGTLVKGECCKKIAHLREMLLEALPYVQDCEVDPCYKETAKAKIKGLAKRIENEVRE